MQLTKEYFDSALADALAKLKKDLKTELKTELKEELVPLITTDVAEKLQPQFSELYRYIREVTDEILVAVGSDLGEIRGVTNEILRAVGTDFGEQQQEITSLDERTDRLEIRMTVVEKAIARSNV